MNKKTAIILIGGIVVAVLVILFLSKNSKQNTESSLFNNSEITEQEISPSTQTKEYIDPAGFKFSYPADLNIEKKDTLNEDSYSSLELISEQYSGKLTLDAVATEAAILDDLIKKNKELQNKTTKKIKVADMNALQYESGNKIITLALDNGVLFIFTADFQEQKNYWSLINDKITSSFTFVPPPNQESNVSSDNSGFDDSVLYEGEEIIE